MPWVSHWEYIKQNNIIFIFFLFQSLDNIIICLIINPFRKFFFFPYLGILYYFIYNSFRYY